MDVASLLSLHKAVVFKQVKKGFGCGVLILWRDSHVTLSFLGLLIILPQVSQFSPHFRELRSLGKSTSSHGIFFPDKKIFIDRMKISKENKRIPNIQRYFQLLTK